MISEVKYEYKSLNTKLLRIPKEYQREYHDAWARNIAKDYNPLMVNPIKVSYRDGAYWVIDGMHTMSALKKLNNDADVDVECKIFFGLTKEDEALVFARQYENTHKVGSRYEMRAKLVGKTPGIVALKDAVEASGFIFDFEGGKIKNRICCYGQLNKIYKDCDNELRFITFLTMIKEIWDGDPESLRKEIIGGMWIFFKLYQGEFDAKRVVEKFSKVSPVEVYRNGRLYKNYSGDKKYAFELVNIYNKNQRTKLDASRLQ